MSEEVKKLTEEEIAKIKEMQQQYNKFVFELGSIETQLADINTHKSAVEADKNDVLNDIKKLGEREKELLSILQEKYGVGNINMETGEVTPL